MFKKLTGVKEIEFAEYDDFFDAKMQEWREDCSMECDECDEEDFIMYVPGGEGELEIIYDERNED